MMKWLEGATRENIKKHGQHLIGVFPVDEADQWFIYTIGNFEKGYAELLCVGIPAEKTLAWALNTLHKLRKERGASFANGELVDLGGRYPVKIIDAVAPATKQDYTLQVSAYYDRDDYKVQQVILCDPKGKWPGEKGCQEPYASQPNLGAH